MTAVDTPPKLDTVPRVLVAHGGGGELMQQLIREHLLPVVGNPLLAPLADSAIVPWRGDEVVFTTDSYVVSPLFFPGGDIGRLAICGTVNDLAVMGADPVAISLGLILEEGLPLETLDQVLASIAAAAREAGVSIVTGDTKVIERQQTGDSDPGLFINTAGIGRLRPGIRLNADRIRPGDCVLVNGPIAEHGLAVMSVRKGLRFGTPLRSDAAPLAGMIAALLESGTDVKFMRDATRGGVAGVLADVSEAARLSIEVDERAIPLSAPARHAAEMLGLDPLAIANEGKIVCVAAASDCERALGALRQHPQGRHATCIGFLTETQPPLVELMTRVGGRRIVQRPYGEDLPRIC